jgi:Tfp pilus assembly protein FimT
MKNSRFTRQSGVSVVELVIVILIVGILVALALARFSNANQNFNRQNIVKEFKVSLERARFDSVKRRPNSDACSDMSGVTINASSFTLMIDLNQNGRLDAGENQQVNFSNRSDVQIVPNGVTLPLTIKFDQRGRAFLNDCSPSSTPTANVPLLFFCSGACTAATVNAENADVLFVSPTGTVAVLNGGESTPTYADASVSNVASNSQINPLLSVWDANAATPTPVPTATPTATPAVTPTGSPSGSPTPTPQACPTSAPWGSPPACTCMSPQTVRNNGQCK